MQVFFLCFYANGPALPVLPALQFWCKDFLLFQVSPVSSAFFNTIFSFHRYEIQSFQGQHHQILYSFPISEAEAKNRQNLPKQPGVCNTGMLSLTGP